MRISLVSRGTVPSGIVSPGTASHGTMSHGTLSRALVLSWSVLVLASPLAWMGCSGGDDPLTPIPTTAPPTITPALPTDTPIIGTLTPTLIPDADNDTFTIEDGDCDDTNASIYPGATEVPYDGIDQDCQGGDLTDVDADTYEALQVGGDDCDDTNPYTYPGAPEIGDAKDNDCDGQVDEDLDDVDNDGDGQSEEQGDCDDANDQIYLDAAEIPYDGIDQDCSGGDLNDLDNDGAIGGPEGPDCNDLDSSVNPTAQEVPYDGIDQDCNGKDLTDVDGDTHDGGPSGDDCDDTDPGRYPGAVEVPYDTRDQDCDGRDLTDVDGDTYDGIPAGGDDCDDEDASVYPSATDIPYDGIDQDCLNGDLVDVDGDGYIATQAGGTDCDDTNVNTYPGATEYLDEQDNNCDGLIDNGLNTYDDDVDGFSEAQGDCNDASNTIYPGATEVPYDGIDQNCDGQDLIDVDGDGFAGGTDGTDCNDNDFLIFPGAVETPYDGIDQDCNGIDLVDVDGDGYDAVGVGGNDCNDNDALINPGAPEKPYDGIDQDCTGEDLTDADFDGYDGAAVNGLDCNDANPEVNPSKSEICNGIDDNCDGIIDTDAIDRPTYYTDADGDTFGDPNAPVLSCTQTTGLVTDNTDCDDTSDLSNPSAAEICDVEDNNCDGTIDEGVTTPYYLDSDADGYGDARFTVQACAVPVGYSANNTDCNDALANVNPGALETCDLLDNDCDTQVDEGVKTTFYLDVDEDGFGDPSKTTQACTAPTGYVALGTDCNDKNSDIYPGANELCNSKDDNCNGQIDDNVSTYTYYQDKDGDFYGNNAVTQSTCLGAPSGYVSRNGDCDDNNAAVNPGAIESCNALDDNCNTQIDEGVKTTWYRDSDNDTWGDPNTSTQACTVPSGYVGNNRDCNDTSASVNPSIAEVCNGIDDNCSGVIDEGVKTTYYADVDKDTYGNPGSSTQACTLPSGYVLNNTDCNDNAATVYPGASETCNGVDDDCDTVTDDGVKTTYYLDADGDGYGNLGVTAQACAAPTSYVSNSTDCNDGNAAVNPGALETCNGVDDNCNGTIDDGGVKLTFYRDADTDGYGSPSSSVLACTAPSGYVTDNTDCNDNAATVNPGATETCNGVDDNCSGVIDEGVKSTFYRDADGDTYGNSALSQQACSAPTGYVSDNTDCNDSLATVYPGATETCNLIDDDCDTVVDDGLQLTWYRDADADTFGNASQSTQACAKPTGFVSNSTDCNDTNNVVYPGAPELCDTLDNDCNSLVDDGVKTYTYYFDGDDDDYGVSTNTQQTCAAAPTGYTGRAGDCNDANPAVNPGASESCNGVDDNCNGTIDDGVKSTYYQDTDADTYGNLSVPTQACAQPSGYVSNSADCDDTKSSVYPGATETCNLIDDNCNTLIDENVKTTFYQDSDGDTYGNAGATVQACTKPSGYVSNSSDCNDSAASVYPGASETCNGVDDDCDLVVDDGVKTTYYLDGDQDGYGLSTVSSQACSAPTGYVANSTDCNDADASINPNATETCNGVDDNCNTQVDEGGVKTTYYRDADTDTYGNPSISVQTCAAPTGYVTNNLDCNDSLSSVYPGATETCNGIDDDCDTVADDGVKTTYYRDADGDTYGNASVTQQACSAPSGYVADKTDCDDANAAVNPASTEACNGIDDNCNTQVDEGGVKTAFYQDADADTFGNPAVSQQACAAPPGYVTDKTDCNDTNDAIYPGATESCNGVDDNCSGQADEGVKTTYYRDNDSDGYGNNAVTQQACSQPLGYVTDNTDCNDTASAVNPGATEICNSVDDDCNSQVDDGLDQTWYRDSDNDSYGNNALPTQACSKPSGYVADNTDCNDQNNTVYPTASELCDSLDNDCNSVVDDGVTTYTYYFDADRDNYGVSSNTKQTCAAAPSGYVALSGDCNDGNAAINPGASESCNGVDDNCSGVIDEGVKTTYYADADSDGYGNSASTTQACSQPSGYVSNNQDCDDTRATAFPGASETCNAKDDDCDGVIDDGVKSTFYLDVDNDGYGVSTSTTIGCTAPDGYASVSGDCNNADSTVYPGATETCNAVDDNCNGVIDEGQTTSTWYRDADSDGFGTSSSTTINCLQPSGYVANSTDCNDNNAAVKPGATEVVNSIDDNCDGVIDYYISCKQKKSFEPSSTNGLVTIDPDQLGTATPFQVYCDMTTDGGGWTLMAIITNGDAQNWIPTSTQWVNATAFGTSTNPSGVADAKSRAYAEVKADQVLVTRGASTVEVQTNTSCLNDTTFLSLFSRNSSSSQNCAYSCTTKTAVSPWTGLSGQDSSRLRFRCMDNNSSLFVVGGFNISSKNNSFITTLNNTSTFYTQQFGLGAGTTGPLGAAIYSDFDVDASTSVSTSDTSPRVLWGR